MKKIILPSVLLLLLLASCSFFGPSPKDVLTKYLDNYYKGNYSETYELLSSKDKNFKSQKKYEAELSDNPFSKLFAGKISFNIKDIKVSGSNAEATVEITGHDLTKMAADLMGIAIASAFGKKNDKEMEKISLKNLRTSHCRRPLLPTNMT